MFFVFLYDAEARVPIFTAKMKKVSNKCQKHKMCLWLFKSHESARTDFHCSKNDFGARPRLPDPGKMEHELRQATHQQRAGGKDDVSLNKLHQIKINIQKALHLDFGP